MTATSLRILLSIHHSLNPDSGAPGATMALGEALRDLDHSVQYLSFDDLPPLPSRIGVVAFPFFAAARLGRADDLDVIDSSTGDTWVWADLRRRLGRRASGPLLVSRSHGLEHLHRLSAVARARRNGERVTVRSRLYHGGYRLWEVAHNLRLADIGLFLTEAERDVAVAELELDPDRTRVLPNGIPDVFFDGIPEFRPSDPEQPVAVAQIGAWRELKGTTESVEAMTEVLDRHPGVTVSYLGTGAGANRVRGNFPERLRDRVRVTPRYRRSDLPRLLADNELQIFPTHSEGLGLGMLEGMACGLAPVASAVTGPSSLLRDGDNGILIPPADPAAIVAAVERLIADRSRLDALRAAARATALEFAQSRIAAATVAVYREALAARPATVEA